MLHSDIYRSFPFRLPLVLPLFLFHEFTTCFISFIPLLRFHLLLILPLFLLHASTICSVSFLSTVILYSLFEICLFLRFFISSDLTFVSLFSLPFHFLPLPFLPPSIIVSQFSFPFHFSLPPFLPPSLSIFSFLFILSLFLLPKFFLYSVSLSILSPFVRFFLHHSFSILFSFSFFLRFILHHSFSIPIPFPFFLRFSLYHSFLFCFPFHSSSVSPSLPPSRTACFFIVFPLAVPLGFASPPRPRPHALSPHALLVPLMQEIRRANERIHKLARRRAGVRGGEFMALS